MFVVVTAIITVLVILNLRIEVKMHRIREKHGTVGEKKWGKTFPTVWGIIIL